MSAYLIAQVLIHDPEIYKQYVARSTVTIAKHGGRILARGGRTEVLEGDSIPRRVVVIEFPSTEAARAWYESPEYQNVRTIRTAVSDAHFVVVQGAE